MPTYEETEESIKKLKNGRVTGEDNNPNIFCTTLYVNGMIKYV